MTATMAAGMTAAPTQTLVHGLRHEEAEETLAGSSDGLRPPSPYTSEPRTHFGRGDQLGRYVLVDELGAGGMGVVFAAYDPDLDRKVALKVLRHDAYGKRRGTEGRSRLLREAQALAKLGHQNVVSIHDTGQHQDQVWIAMEFIKGQTLDELFTAGTSSWREVTELMLQAGEGLAAAHAKGLVHRDFKPANVMVDDQGRVRVMDFGLVHVDESQTDDGLASEASTGSVLANGLTQLGAVIGTPAYMAPEQHRGWSTDARTDQFSFCLTLWLGLYDERPFAGKTLAELAYNVTSGIIREPPKSEVPGWLEALLRRGLAVEPVDRWASMVELIAAIRAGLERRSRSPWRWIVAAAGLAGLVAGAWGLWTFDRLRTIEACEDAGAAITSSWTADHRARAAEAFRATGLGFADESWTRTAELFDDWSARWSKQRTQACVEAKLHDKWTDEAYADVVACFELREAELAALVDVSTAADETFVPRAVSTASHLGDPSLCLDPAWLTMQLMPEDPQARARAQELRQATVWASTQVYAANYDEALRGAEEALEGAKELAWAPLEAEARYVLASVHNGRGELDEAITLHREAFFIAAEAGHDHLAARAATSLVGLYSRESEADTALHWAELGQTFLARSSFAGNAEHSALLINRGAVLMDTDNYEEARDSFTEAIALFEDDLGSEHPDLIVPLINLGIVQRKLDRDDLASESFLHATDLAKRHLGEHHPMHATALINVGTIHSANKRYYEALAVQNQAIEVLTLAYSADDPRVAIALNNKASALFKLGRLDEALATHQKVLGIRETLGPEHPSVANSAVNVANVLLALGRAEDALPHAERALAIRVAVYGDGHSRVAGSKYILSTMLLALGRFDEAAVLLREARAIRLELSGSDHWLTAVTEAALARAEFELGHDGQARELLDHALPIVEAKDEPCRYGARFDRIRLDYRGGQMDEALAAAEALRDEMAAIDAANDGSGQRRRRLPELEAWLAARR